MKRDRKVQPPIVYEQIPIGIVERSLQGRYTSVNDEFCEIVGYEKGELLTLSFKDITPEEDYPLDIRLHQELIEGKIPSYRLEKRYIRKDGKIAWVELTCSLVRSAEGKALYTVGAVLDVTERKRAEKALRELNLELEQRVQARTAELQLANETLRAEIEERKEAEELLKSWAHIFEHAEWGIATISKDTFVMMNPMFAKMHGYTVEELAGRSIYDLLAPSSHQYTREQIRIAYQSGHHLYESTHLRKDGSTFPALVDTSVVRDSQGNVLYRAVNVQDITERKQAEQALQESRRYLQVLSRRLVEVQEEERRTLARELHDRVGQNLSALSLNLSMLRDELPGDPAPEIAARLSDSLNLVADTTRLVRNLLAELRPTVLDDEGLEQALQAYLEEFTHRYSIAVALDVAQASLPRLSPSLEITLLRIAQEALTNVARHAQADRAALWLRLENEAVHLTIRDNGIGVGASQGKKQRASHGLKIMHERAAAFGGTVTIGPSQAGGTSVEVVIPTGNAQRADDEGEP